jgi:hypothetical protein
MEMYIMLTMFIAVIGYAVHVDIRKDNEHRKEKEQWNAERQQLLDRIQAPSFDHLKHHEAKILKASKETTKKEEMRLEPV